MKILLVHFSFSGNNALEAQLYLLTDKRPARVIQWSISSLLPADRRKVAGSSGPLRLEKEDLKFFQPVIDGLVKELGEKKVMAVTR